MDVRFEGERQGNSSTRLCLLLHSRSKALGITSIEPSTKNGHTIDFLFRKNRDKAAARAFYDKAFGSSSQPDKVTLNKSGANFAALQDINNEIEKTLEIRQIKYLNNVVEQDHRFIKRITRSMLGFKVFDSAESTLSGIELCHMLKKGQYANAETIPAFEYFYQLAA